MKTKKPVEHEGHEGHRGGNC